MINKQKGNSTWLEYFENVAYSEAYGCKVSVCNNYGDLVETQMQAAYSVNECTYINALRQDCNKNTDILIEPLDLPQSNL